MVPSDQSSEVPVDFSFVVPAKNEGAFIGRCLSSLTSTLAPDITAEILVVDNGSRDQTVATAKSIEGVRLLTFDHGNVGAVRNHGAWNARGRYLVFIDADCLVDAGFLQRVATLTQAQPSTVFGGGAALPDNATWVEQHWLLENQGRTLLPRHLIGACIVIPRTQFDAIGGFSEVLESGEDSDLHLRLARSGVAIQITGDLNVVHLGNAKTLREFVKRQAWHGRCYHVNPLRNLRDPVYLLIIVWVLTGLTSLLVYPGHAVYGVGLSTVFLALPALLTAKRFRRTGRRPASLTELFRCYCLDVAYAVGRIAGLIGKLSNMKSQQKTVP